MVSPSLTTEKFNPHRYGIKKAACRLSEEKPTGHTCSEKSFIFNGRNTGTRKSYYIINFANENGVYKNVYYIRRNRNLLFLCVLVFRLNLCCVIKAYPACAGFEPSPARRGAFAGLHLNNGEHSLAGKLPGLGVVRPRSSADVQVGDTDLDEEWNLRSSCCLRV